jgi:hypothetical protein
MGTMGWKPSGAVRLGTGSRGVSRGGLRRSMHNRMSEWQKKIVMLRRRRMKRM